MKVREICLGFFLESDARLCFCYAAIYVSIVCRIALGLVLSTVVLCTQFHVKFSNKAIKLAPLTGVTARCPFSTSFGGRTSSISLSTFTSSTPVRWKEGVQEERCSESPRFSSMHRKRVPPSFGLLNASRRKQLLRVFRRPD